MRGTILTATVALTLLAATSAWAQMARVMGTWRMQGPSGSMTLVLDPTGARYVGETGEDREEDAQAMRYQEQGDGSVVMTEVNADGSAGEAATGVLTAPDTLVITRQGGQRMEFQRAPDASAPPASK